MLLRAKHFVPASHSTIRYPTILVNYTVQIVRIKFFGLFLFDFHSEPFQFGTQMLEALVGLDAVIDQIVNRFNDRVVHPVGDRVGRKTAGLAIATFDHPRA